MIYIKNDDVSKTYERVYKYICHKKKCTHIIGDIWKFTYVSMTYGRVSKFRWCIKV